MIKAVIFSLDDVLVATYELHYQSWQRLANELGIKTFTKEEHVRQRGIGRMESLEIVLEKSGKSFTDKDKALFAERKNNYFMELLASLSSSSVLPGVLSTVSYLVQKDILTAVGSASKNAHLILHKTGLASHFDAVVDGFDTTHYKPDPQVFMIAAGKLGVIPEHCLAIEDNDAGVKAAHTAGMLTLGIGFAAKTPLVDFSAENLADKSLDWDKVLMHL